MEFSHGILFYTFRGNPEFSEASGPILIKFYVNHHWIGGLTASGF